MPFPKDVKEIALVNSRRCCCVCHIFSGLYTNVHHIVPESEGGPDVIENAIVLCLRCHGEAGHYNLKHPIGNKYSPDELRLHRDKWWADCEKNPTKSLPGEPISISPNSFKLISGKWATKLIVKISNRTENVLYDVAVKFSIRVKGIQAKDLIFGVPKREFILTHRIENDAEFSGDIIRLIGVDSAGYEMFIVYIYVLDPRETITFTLTNSSSNTPSSQHNQHVVVTLQGYNEEPTEMLIHENEAAIRFVPYEDWTVSSVGVLLKKTKK